MDPRLRFVAPFDLDRERERLRNERKEVYNSRIAALKEERDRRVNGMNGLMPKLEKLRVVQLVIQEKIADIQQRTTRSRIEKLASQGRIRESIAMFKADFEHISKHTSSVITSDQILSDLEAKVKRTVEAMHSEQVEFVVPASEKIEWKFPEDESS